MLSWQKTTYSTLSFLISKVHQSATRSKLIFTMPLNRTPLTKAFWRHLAFLPSRTRLNLTVIQIMQLKRSYSRRLKFGLAFNVYQCHYTTCLPFNESRCQNQSTPLVIFIFGVSLFRQDFRGSGFR